MLLAVTLSWWLLQLLAAPAVRAKEFGDAVHLNELGHDYNCPGGVMYFSAHPVDALLYQNPDLYHEVSTLQCTTLVVFTSGDRGRGNDSEFTASLEHGLEASYALMAGESVRESRWDGVNVICGDKVVTLRYPTEAKGHLIIYLRLPDGASDGRGYAETGQLSLKRLYLSNIETITSLGGETTYTLESLKNLVRTLIDWKLPRSIGMLDDVTPIAKDGDYDAEHADHSVSARIVADVVKQWSIPGNVTSYAGNLMRKSKPTLSDEDFEAKASAYFEYAKYDKDMCKSYSECFKLSGLHQKEVPDDVKYTVNYLDRQYHVV